MRNFIGLVLTFGLIFTAAAHASEIRLECQGGIPGSNSFQARLQVQGGQVLAHFFKGEGVHSGASNPSGETVLLRATRQGAHGWVIFSGYGARYFELGLRAGDLSPGNRFHSSLQVSKPLRNRIGNPMANYVLEAYQFDCLAI